MVPVRPSQPMPSPAATGLAVFDLDRTMVRGSSLAYLGRALAEARLVGRGACGSPVAVNPDSKLRCLATASGWPILRLR